MSKSSAVRIFAFLFLGIGIAVTYMAATGCFTGGVAADTQFSQAPEQPISTGNAQPAKGSSAEGDFDPKTEKTVIDMVRENPNAIPLEPRDPSRNLLDLFRDPNDNPKREPGPINIQKAVGGLIYQGIPTFFRSPVALGPEDLKAGRVEVAIMGASLDLSTGMRGCAFGP